MILPVKDLNIGMSFGIISGILTTIGIILGNVGAATSKKIIILNLIALALSDSFSDALGIYYGSYADDEDFKKSIKEGINAFIGKSIIPLTMALIFYLLSMSNAILLNLLLAIGGIILITIKLFGINRVLAMNMTAFVGIVTLNYFVGQYLG